jgi:hypothetical protein
MKKSQRMEMMKWAVKEGFVLPCTVYEVRYFDDEWESEVVMKFLERDEAEENSPDGEITPIKGYRSTAKMQQRTLSNAEPLLVEDLVSTLFAEDYLQIDGVWWDDQLDVSRYSAPRGVIVP